MQVSFPKLGLEFYIDSVAFSIGSFEVKWYGIIIATGLLLAVLYAMKRASFFRVNTDKLLDAVIVGVLCGVVGARLYYVIFSWDYFKDDPIRIITDFRHGGLAIYGGVIGGLLGCNHPTKVPSRFLMDHIAIAANMLVHSPASSERVE